MGYLSLVSFIVFTTGMPPSEEEEEEESFAVFLADTVSSPLLLSEEHPPPTIVKTTAAVVIVFYDYSVHINHYFSPLTFLSSSLISLVAGDSTFTGSPIASSYAFRNLPDETSCSLA